MAKLSESTDMGEDGGLRLWNVAGAVMVDQRGLLLVKNVRRSGREDWSPPGGVIEPGEDPVEGLTREVYEETGLTVASWSDVIYRVEVVAPDHGYVLKVEARRALSFSGQIVVDDPDGIVVAADFVTFPEAETRIGSDQPWISHPLFDHLVHGVTDGRTYRYRMTLAADGDKLIERTDDNPGDRP